MNGLLPNSRVVVVQADCRIDPLEVSPATEFVQKGYKHFVAVGVVNRRVNRASQNV